MRLIDADELLLTLEKEQAYLEEENSLNRSFGIGDAIIDLVSAPTVNAVEVVRCKDCKRWCNEIDEHTYECCTRAIVNRFKPTDYCSYGERKEE